MGIRVCLVLFVCSALTGCAGLSQPNAQVQTASKRDLSAAEKTALTPIISAGLKDPTSAQFKWMPVVISERNGATDYCGLVNAKNSYGGYGGFVRFYAQLLKDDKGQFTKATVRAVEQPGREINPLDPRWLNGICEQFGYQDFGGAT